MKYSGKDLNIYIERNGKRQKVAYSQSCELDINRGLVSIAGFSRSLWDNVKGDRCGWSVSGSSILTDDISTTMQWLIEGTNMWLEFGVDGQTKRGKAILSRVHNTGNNRSIGSMDLEFIGNGRLSPVSVDYKSLIYNTDWFTKDLKLKNY